MVRLECSFKNDYLQFLVLESHRVSLSRFLMDSTERNLEWSMLRYSEFVYSNFFPQYFPFRAPTTRRFFPISSIRPPILLPADYHLMWERSICYRVSSPPSIIILMMYFPGSMVNETLHVNSCGQVSNYYF